MSDAKKILVLGATGTVGEQVVSALLEQGHTVVAATRDPSEKPAGPENLHYVAFDYKDQDTYAAALDGVQRLFLLSPGGHVDVYGLLSPVLTAALASPSLERVVLMTARGVEYAPAEAPMRHLELTLKQGDTPYVILRPDWFAQNFHTYWGEGVRAHGTLALPAGDQPVAFIDTRDIGLSAAAALTRDDIELDRGYTLTGPEALTHAQVAETLSSLLERPVVYQDISEDAFREMVGPFMDAAYVDLMISLFSFIRQGASSTTTQDVETLTGKAPRPFASYVRDYRDALSA